MGWRVSHRPRTCRAARASHLLGSVASDPGAGSPGVGDEMKERLAAPLSFWRSNALEGLPSPRGHWRCRDGSTSDQSQRSARRSHGYRPTACLSQSMKRELTERVRIDREGEVVQECRLEPGHAGDGRQRSRRAWTAVRGMDDRSYRIIADAGVVSAESRLVYAG